jgi:hypothetical protein
MAEEQKTETDPKLFILGVVLGSITIGVAIWIILKGIRDTLSGLGNAQSQQPINIYNVMSPQGPLQLPPPLQAPMAIQPSAIANAMQLGAISLGTRTDTITLSTTEIRRVFSAPIDGPTWKLRIAAIGPAGGFAVLAVDSQPDPSGGRSVIVPAGDHTELIVGPRQIVSGLAVTSDTQVSYVAQAEVV